MLCSWIIDLLHQERKWTKCGVRGIWEMKWNQRENECNNIMNVWSGNNNNNKEKNMYKTKKLHFAIC
jgi:hypothetical protein